MKKHRMFLSVALFSSSVISSTVSAMTIFEALSYSYNNNHSIKASQQKFLQEIETFPQALAAFLPTVQMQISTSNSTQTVKNLPNGSPDNKSESGPDVRRALSIRQNIYRGGHDSYGLKIAQSQFQISKSDLYLAEQEVLNNVIKTYLNLCAAQEKYDLSVSDQELHKKTLDMTLERMKLGEATLTDEATARANYAQSESNVAQAMASLISAKANFIELTGVESAEGVDYPEIPSDLPKDFDSFKSSVFNTNLDLVKIKAQVMQSKDAVKQGYGDLLPSVDLSITDQSNYNKPVDWQNGRYPNVRGVSTEVSVNIPIYYQGGAVYSKIRQNKARSRQSVYALESVKRNIDSKLVSTWEGYKYYGTAVSALEESVKAYTVALDGMMSGYKVGTQNILDVLNQQNKLNEAKSRLIEIKNQQLTAVYTMKQLLGQLTAKNMNLKVDKLFNPEREFLNVKHKIIGVR